MLILRTALHSFLFLLFTLVTQVGGVIYLLALFISSRLKLTRLIRFALFIAVYLLATFLFIPLLAPANGRIALPMWGDIRPVTLFTCLLNRHYVSKTLHEQLAITAKSLNSNSSNLSIHYMDANFPFWDGFPLIPHLSHDDGKKVDLAFYYNDSSKNYGETPSPIGYGFYEGPTSTEDNLPLKCKERGFWQYDLLGSMVPSWSINHRLRLDTENTKMLIEFLAKSPKTDKIFLEPHLKTRWGLIEYENIRFHGCHAVRHDDHIHYQIK